MLRARDPECQNDFSVMQEMLPSHHHSFLDRTLTNTFHSSVLKWHITLIVEGNEINKNRLYVVGKCRAFRCVFCRHLPLLAAAITTSARQHVTNIRHGIRLSHKSNDYSEDIPYRSIGEVVGGLHGGKYQFQGVGGSEYILSSTTNDRHDDISRERQELPKWALRMKPSEDASILEVPSNANRKNGMIRSASVTVGNDERTWEQFHAKIVCNHADNSDLFMVRPSSGDLAPRGGASNACDKSQPYSDSATINVIHNEKGATIADRWYGVLVGRRHGGRTVVVSLKTLI